MCIRATTTRSVRIVRRREAFTLLEVIFAIGLSLVLMVALLEAVDLYRRVSSTGRRAVEQAQLVRAILRKMEIDIRSCTYRNPLLEPAEDEEEQSTDSTGEETSSEETTVTSIDPADAFAGKSIGIFGDTTTLIVHVNRPTRDLRSLVSGEGTATNPASGNLKSIAYFLAAPGAEGLQGAAGDLLQSQGQSAVSGLARLEGDRLTLEHADTTSDLQTMAEQTTLLASEVISLQFRYFDGSSWQDVWDSVSQERLPNAVEITIGLREAEPSDGEKPTENAEATSTATYRYVVAVPIAESPYSSTSASSSVATESP